MRVPLSWLREFVAVEADPDELAERLSLAGLAVDEVVRPGSGMRGVVVGEVAAVRDHPDADQLILVDVETGSGIREIVCGARNIGAGDRVPVALPGARLPDGMEISRRRVRGQLSDGMLCSPRELGVSEDHGGILLLDGDTSLGADVRTALGLDDPVLVLDVTPNRPDALSVVGVARDVAALYGLPLRAGVAPDESPPPAPEDGPAVQIEDPRGCPRYLAQVLTGVQIGPSPWWLRRRLLAAGMRPISNVVDITNYVMLERGQPLHAFDLDRLEGGAIVVRRPRKGETIRTLDEVERALDRGDVLICDAVRPVALGGVMGGADAEVGTATNRILLESASFDPVRILRTARRAGLRTEASVRFERGADPEAVPVAAARAASLLASLAGAKPSRPVDVYARPAKGRRIALRIKRTNALLGTAATGPEMAGWLTAIGCRVTDGRGTLRVEPPTFRPDIVAEEDLLEEVARLHGFDRIPGALPPNRQGGGLTAEQERRELVRRILRGAGLSEAQTLSLLPPWIPDRLDLPSGHPWRAAPRVANPLSEEESVLRPSLLPGLLLAAARNAARRPSGITLFEQGTVFGPAAGAEDGRPPEHGEVAWILTGEAPRRWHRPARPFDYMDATGVLETLFDALGVSEWDLSPARGEPFTHPGRSAEVGIAGRRAGIVAELDPRIGSAFELTGRVAVCALDLGAVLGAAAGFVARTVPRYPAVLRDIAIVVPAPTPASNVGAVVREAGGALLESADLFDVYRGERIAQGATSLAYALSFRAPDRTLSDAEVDACQTQILAAIRAAGWSLRE